MVNVLRKAEQFHDLALQVRERCLVPLTVDKKHLLASKRLQEGFYRQARGRFSGLSFGQPSNFFKVCPTRLID